MAIRTLKFRKAQNMRLLRWYWRITKNALRHRETGHFFRDVRDSLVAKFKWYFSTLFITLSFSVIWLLLPTPVTETITKGLVIGWSYTSAFVVTVWIFIRDLAAVIGGRVSSIMGPVKPFFAWLASLDLDAGRQNFMTVLLYAMVFVITFSVSISFLIIPTKFILYTFNAEKPSMTSMKVATALVTVGALFIGYQAAMSNTAKSVVTFVSNQF